MPTRGLLLDEDELEKKGIDHESAQKMALESFYERPVEQQLVELRILCDDVATKLELVRDHLDEQTLSEMQATIDGMSVQIKHLEKICRPRAKVKAKADTKTDIARKRLVDHLRQVPTKVPTEGEAPINKWSRNIKEFLDDYDRKQADADDFDKAFARLTDHERVETGFQWLNNLMANDYADAKKMGFSREHCAEFYSSLTKMQAILDTEDRVKKLPNDPATPLQKDAADRLLAQMDAKGRKAIYISPNDILGRKRGN